MSSDPVFRETVPLDPKVQEWLDGQELVTIDYLRRVEAERDRYRQALEDITQDPGTSYRLIARKALDG